MLVTILKRIGLLFFCFLTILSISCLTPNKMMAAETIKIGVMDNFSGPFAFTGALYSSGVEFVANDYNKKGGLLGKKIEILKADIEMKPDVAVRKGKKLILEDKVDFFAVTYSHIAIALSKVVGTYKSSVLIGHGATADSITGKEFNEYAFRLVFSSYSMGSALAQYVATKPFRKYYVICQDYSAGHEYAEAFKESLKIYLPEAKIVGEDYHPLGQKDFAPYITKIQRSGADVVFTASYGPDLINLIKQARSLGLAAPFPFVAPYVSEPMNLQELGKDALGTVAAWNYFPDVNTPENKAMVKAYHAIHKDDNNLTTVWPISTLGGVICSWQMTLAAAEKAGSVEPQKFIPAFENFEYKTPVGLWKMRKCDHSVILPMFVAPLNDFKNPYWPSIPCWAGPEIITIPGEKCAKPATKEYNPRCP